MSKRRFVWLVVAVLGAWCVLLVGGGLLVVRFVRGAGRAGVPLLARTGRGKPLPCGPEAFTAVRYQEIRRQFHRKRTTGAYEQFGHHNPVWDKLAIELEEQQFRWAVGEGKRLEPKALGTLARRVLQTGCDDPHILTQAGRVLMRVGDKPAAEPAIAQALRLLPKSRYPVYCRFGAPYAMAGLKGELGHKLEGPGLQWREQTVLALVEAANSKFFDKYEQRVFWNDYLEPLMEDELRRSQASIINTMKAHPEVDQWLFRMAWGKHNNDYAWSKRGGGWAENVHADDWKVFAEGEKYARGNWEKAYALHPEYPEAAACLIGVVNATGGGDCRDWFDKAVAAQFDWMPAYSSLRFSLMPRWGGSHQAMLAFAEECLNTKRFDTAVPREYPQTILEISENDRDTDIWKQPGIWENLKVYYDGAIADAVAHDPDDEKPLRTTCLLMAWRSGHLDEARRQLDAMKGAVDQWTFDTRWCERAELVTGLIYALTGPRKDEVQRAEQLFDTGVAANALPAFETLLRGEPDPHVKFYLRDRLQTLQWEKQYAAGGWVNLDATTDLVGWDPWQGKFRPLPDGKGFVVNPNERAAVLVNHMRTGQYFEIRCDVEFPEGKVKGVEAGFLANLAMVADPYYDCLRIVREPGTALCGPGLEGTKEHALGEVPRKLHMRLVKCDDRYTMYLNDQTVFQDEEMTEHGIRGSGPHHAGIGGESWPDPSKPVIYRNIQIRQISGKAAKG